MAQKYYIKKIYTKTGDSGTTSLVGGTRVPKNHPRVEAYGTVDELNSHAFDVLKIEIDGITASFGSFEVQRNFACLIAERDGVVVAVLWDVKLGVILVEDEFLKLAVRVESHDRLVLEGIASYVCLCQCHLQVAVVAC